MLLVIINLGASNSNERTIETEIVDKHDSDFIKFKCSDGSGCSCSCSLWSSKTSFTLSSGNVKISCKLNDQYSLNKVDKCRESSTR